MGNRIVDKNIGHATAYGYAKAGGYSGTEEEFAELMASYADVAERAEESAGSAAQSAEESDRSREAAATEAASSAESAAAAAQSASDAAVIAAGSFSSTGSVNIAVKEDSTVRMTFTKEG